MNKPIEVIAHFDKTGKVIPYRLKLEDAKQENRIIRVDRIIKEKERRYNGNPMRIYTCRVTESGRQRQIILFYEVDKCTWSLGTF